MEKEKRIHKLSDLKTIYDELRESIKNRGETHDAMASNMEKLQAQETNSENLIRWYKKALSEYPELKEVEILQKTESGFNARSIPKHSENNTSGHHEILLDLKPGSEVALLEELQPRKETLKYVANRLNISVDQLTPELIQAYAMLHELGHSLDHIRTKRPPSERTKLRNHEMATLPIGNATVNDLLDEDLQQKITEKYSDVFEGTSKKYNVPINNFDDIIKLQEIEYKKLPSELYADDFAISILTGAYFDADKTP